MLAVSPAMSGAAQQQQQAHHGGGGEIDAAALDLLWGGEGSMLPPLSSADVDADAGIASAAAAAAAADARGKRPAALSSEASLLRDVADRTIADHLAYEYGTRAPGDTARPAPPPEDGDDDDGGEGDGDVGDGDGESNSRKAPRTAAGGGPRRTTSGPSESAARAKANRERARRERLNDFVSRESREKNEEGENREDQSDRGCFLSLRSRRRLQPPRACGERTLSLFSYLTPTRVFFSLPPQKSKQQFAELVRAMAPCQGTAGGPGGGNGPSTSSASLLRTDKTSVVADAIRLITALRAENGQLKQLNKFMEQRLASVERERAELMMRAAYAAGIASNGGGGVGGGGGGNNGGASGSAAAAALPPLSSSAAAAAAAAPPPQIDAAAAVAMLPPPWLPSSDLDTSLDGSKRPPAA